MTAEPEHGPRRRVRAAILGYGAIGAEVAAQAQTAPGIDIAYVLVRAARRAALQDHLPRGTSAINDMSEITEPVEVVLEAAGHTALRDHGADILARGMDLCVASVGALADDGLYAALREAARHGGARLELLPGAIGGIDAVAAAGREGLSELRYTGRKPPAAWAGSPAEDLCDLIGLTSPCVFFDGSARDAARLFPKNANVVATVALAGLGLDATRAQLIADPGAAGNSHRIEAHGPLVRFDFTTQGSPLPANPKSSALTAMSALRALKNRAGPISL